MRSKAANGGLPEPPPGELVRVVSCAHLTCGADTRVRLPAELPAAALRRVVCSGCGRSFECRLVAEVSAPRSGAGEDGRHGWLDRHPGRAWRLLSIPIAAVAVIAILALIRALGG